MTTTATLTDVGVRLVMVAKIVSLDDPERLTIVYFHPMLIAISWRRS